MRRRVLVSWVAVNNDPYERERSGGSFRLVDGAPVPGPTLTLLFDPESPYAGTVSDVVLFFGQSADGRATRESRAARRVTMDELWRCAVQCRVANVMRPYMESLS